MARDTIKYVYYTMGFLRNGPTHQAIQADAEELDAQEPTAAKFRLAQFYELRQAGKLYAVESPVEPAVTHHNEHLAADVEANASEAANAWPE